MLSTPVYGAPYLALNLNGADEELTRTDLIALAQTFGVREAAVATRLDAMLAKAHPWLERLGEIGFEPLLTDRLKGALTERHEALSS